MLIWAMQAQEVIEVVPLEKPTILESWWDTTVAASYVIVTLAFPLFAMFFTMRRRAIENLKEWMRSVAGVKAVDRIVDGIQVQEIVPVSNRASDQRMAVITDKLNEMQELNTTQHTRVDEKFDELRLEIRESSTRLDGHITQHEQRAARIELQNDRIIEKLMD